MIPKVTELFSNNGDKSNCIREILRKTRIDEFLTLLMYWRAIWRWWDRVPNVFL
jgi:hypothetical protein